VVLSPISTLRRAQVYPAKVVALASTTTTQLSHKEPNDILLNLERLAKESFSTDPRTATTIAQLEMT
jgi:hypothetical protein